MPPHDSNDANKKERENVCPVSFKLKGKYVSIAIIYNERFGLGNYTRMIASIIILV